VAKRQARYRKTHPEEFRLSCAQRRALKYGNTPINELLTSTEWLAILALADGHCVYCGHEAKLTLDHVIPLSKGGKHSKDNVVAACLCCNDSKGNKTLEEWNTKRLIQAKK
jgi:5-methylcytosine-specific restriction endonuclease McrA